VTEGPQPQEGSQEPQKGVGRTLKDDAALLAAIIGLFGVVITGGVNACIANNDQAAQRELEATNAQRQRELEAFNAEKQRELEQEKAQDAVLKTPRPDGPNVNQQ